MSRTDEETTALRQRGKSSAATDAAGLTGRDTLTEIQFIICLILTPHYDPNHEPFRFIYLKGLRVVLNNKAHGWKGKKSRFRADYTDTNKSVLF